MIFCHKICKLPSYRKFIWLYWRVSGFMEIVILCWCIPELQYEYNVHCKLMWCMFDHWRVPLAVYMVLRALLPCLSDIICLIELAIHTAILIAVLLVNTMLWPINQYGNILTSEYIVRYNTANSGATHFLNVCTCQTILEDVY